jgi:hypothetical protein
VPSFPKWLLLFCLALFALAVALVLVGTTFGDGFDLRLVPLLLGAAFLSYQIVKELRRRAATSA